MSEEKRFYIGRTFLNSFHYLTQDGDFLRTLAAKADGFDRVRLCRTAVLLFVFGLEALINRCMDHFLLETQRDFFLGREQKLTFLDKFELVPLLVTGKTFDKSQVVWAKLKELHQLRNDYVHPKHDRVAYLKFDSKKEMEPLDPNMVPNGVPIDVRVLEYTHLKVPKDPYSVLPEHLDRVQDATGDVLQELNRLLDGRVTNNGWHIKDQIEVVYPEGATWGDIADGPLEKMPVLRGGITETHVQETRNRESTNVTTNSESKEAVMEVGEYDVLETLKGGCSKCGCDMERVRVVQKAGEEGYIYIRCTNTKCEHTLRDN